MKNQLTMSMGAIAAAVALLLAAPAQATVVEVGTEVGNGADAGLYNDGPILGTIFADSNQHDFFSFDVRISTQGGFNERMRAGLVRWDLSGVTEDFNNIASAGLRVNSVLGRRGIDIYGLNDGDAEESWIESATTWNTAPGITPNPGGATDILSVAGLVDTNRYTYLGTVEFSASKSDLWNVRDKASTSYLSTENPAGWTAAYPGGPMGTPGAYTNEGGPLTTVFEDDFGVLPHDPNFKINLANFLKADTDDQATLLFMPRDPAGTPGVGARESGEVGIITKDEDDSTPEEQSFIFVTTPTLVMEFGAGLEGDLNGDGFVGIGDLNIVLGNWNQNVPPADPAADPSGDGFVGIDDLNAVLGNWNAGTPPSAGATIPEPGTLVLLGAGGHMIMLRRRYRKDQ